MNVFLCNILKLFLNVYLTVQMNERVNQIQKKFGRYDLKAGKSSFVVICSKNE